MELCWAGRGPTARRQSAEAIQDSEERKMQGRKGCRGKREEREGKRKEASATLATSAAMPAASRKELSWAGRARGLSSAPESPESISRREGTALTVLSQLEAQGQQLEA